ncbi:MAG: DUF4115 domain-containing protein [Deltaproteobacteria bacterium]|nr:DUF4115 domain-containing protein [Deltaproteobacteria bacterium]MBW2085253.1 DUF4115 domain-containing protein [Deltaproteobacteria bacterium]
MEVTSETFGQHLKKERENKGLTLEEVSKAIRVPVHNLEALESGDDTRLPASVYVKGFIRAYARELELDEQELLEEYNNIYDVAPESVQPPITAVQTQNNYILPIVVIALFVAAVLALGGYYLFSRQKKPASLAPTPQVSMPAPVEQKPTAEMFASLAEIPVPDEAMEQTAEPGPPLTEAPGTADKETAREHSTAQPEAPEEIQAAAEEPGGAPLVQDATPTFEGGQHTLRVDVIEETWIRIFIDGQRTKQYLLSAGETMSWQAEKLFKLKIGNAGGIKLFLDGEALPPIGERGQVKEITLPQPRENP